MSQQFAAVQGQMQAAMAQGVQMIRPQTQWVDGICSCFSDCGSCMDVHFCQCCQIGRQCEAISGRPNNHSCLLCCCNCAAGNPAMILRYRMVERYNIEETVVATCCYATFCQECTYCQIHRQLKAMGCPPGGFCCGSTEVPGAVSAPMK